MSLTPQQQRAIIEKESAWVDESFGQLDLSAFPALAPQPVPETHDSKFAREWNDTGLNRSAADLRAFIENPDLESLARRPFLAKRADARYCSTKCRTRASRHPEARSAAVERPGRNR